MRILSLNTQKAFHPALPSFLKTIFEVGAYDFILLQEANERVLPLIQGIGSYNLLEAFDDHMLAQGHLVIAYRKTFTMKDAFLDSYGTMHPSARSRHAGLGVLLGTFQTPQGNLIVGSVHLHSGLRVAVRVRELRRLREKVLEILDDTTPVILGGDFNFGIPGEVVQACKFLSPQFVSKTRYLEPTLNSRFTEPNSNITNIGAVFLAKFGMGLNLKTDHFFTDAETAKHSEARILSDRVSDHSPIELTIL